MNEYFLNAELRRSTTVLLGLLLCFGLVMLIMLDYHHHQLKLEYIKTLGAIAAKVEAKNPALLPEIIPSIIKGAAPGEELAGQSLLREYGLTLKLEGRLFPHLQTTIWRNLLTLGLIFTVMALLFLVLNYLQHIFFYQRIRQITEGAKKIIEGQYDIAIAEDAEGDLSKLANSFNKMGSIIRTNLSALNKEKEFLVELMSDISHQLKTPLSSLILYNDIMLNKDLTPGQRTDFLQKKQAQLERMKWLIHSILKLARLDARSIEFVKEVQSLNETIHNAIDTLESKAAAGSVKVVFTGDAEVLFLHDRLWIEEALINIIKNGIEHTPEGGQVTIAVTQNPLYKRITITDTGEGIGAEELGSIFKRFYKVQTKVKKDSLGIGLALAKSIIESHGGIIEVESEVGKGTKFIVTFL